MCMHTEIYRKKTSLLKKLKVFDCHLRLIQEISWLDSLLLASETKHHYIYSLLPGTPTTYSVIKDKTFNKCYRFPVLAWKDAAFVPEDMKFNNRLHLKVRRGDIISLDDTAVNKPELRFANTAQKAKVVMRHT